ncbi:MAG TPA: SurA N-terminal domain-containing protein [Rhodanobacteraceae bacterium]|jgi:peptidyl-prolyl cis-trans isomerase D|nr:SurA N-terminal domain-containing protein [Rhodanobacteraceae bacterium]
MLQTIRNLFKNWIVITIFGIVVAIAFLFFGVEGYFSQSNETWVAKVGGHEVSQQDFTNAMNNARERQLSDPNNKMEAADFQKPAFKQGVLKQLVNHQLLLNANDALGIKVPDAAVREQIAANPAFQVDGKFDPTVYISALAQRAISAQQYQDDVRSSLAGQELPSAIIGTAFATKAEAEEFLRLQLQQRDFSYVDLAPPAPNAQESQVSDAEIAAYYKQHPKDFMSPEQVSVHYIELDAATMKVTPDLSDKALQARYEKEKATFVSPPQWNVAHIMIKLPAKATAAQKQAALKQAQHVDELAKAPGADFAALAKQYSDDLGSKNQGGELGWLQKGDAGPEFQAALDKMTKGEISAPVLTADGYHIIDLLDVRPGHSETFAQVRDQLAAEASKDARSDQYREVSNNLTDMIYDDPTSLAPAAKKLGLTVQTTPLFGRDGAKEGLAANPDVVKAAFSDTVLTQDNTSDPINLGKDHIVVIHVAKHVAAAPKPLAEVSDQIKQAIIAERVDARAKTLADAAYAKLQSGTKLDALATAAGQAVQQKTGVMRNDTTIDQELLQAVFKLQHPAKDAATRALVPLANGHFALVVLSAVKPGDPSKVPAEAQTFLREQMARAFGMLDVIDYVDVLRKNTKVETAPQRL